MPENAKDVYAILDELKKRACGMSDAFPNGNEGQIMSFLPIAEAIYPDDFRNPWKPQLTSPANSTEPADPATVSAEIAKRYETLANTCTLVDRKLKISDVYQSMETSSTLSQTWENIVKAAQIVQSDPALADFYKQQFETYHKRLRKTFTDADGDTAEVDTPEYKAYKEYQEKYYMAKRLYAAAYRAALKDPLTAGSWAVEGQFYLSKVNQAWQEWTSLGYKEPIEEAIDQTSAMGTDPSAHAIARAKQRFDLFSVATHGVIPVTSQYVEVFPSNWCEPDQNDGWTTYEYSATETHQASSSANTTYGGSAGISAGFWNASANASHNERTEHNDLTVDGLEVKFSYALLSINRPWLDTLLFDLNTWYLRSNQPGAYPKGSISSGKMDQLLPQNGGSNWLPIIPKHVLVIKNLFIKTSHIGEQFDSLKTQTDAGGSIGFGPFKLSGTYSHSKSNQTFSGKVEGEGLKVEGVQILGWLSHLVQLSPKIDPPPIT